MKCLFCPDEVKDFDKLSECHLVATEYSIGNRESHIHVHGSLEDRRGIITIIDSIIKEVGLEDTYVRVIKPEKKG